MKKVMNAIKEKYLLLELYAPLGSEEVLISLTRADRASDELLFVNVYSADRVAKGKFSHFFLLRHLQ